LSTPLRSGCQRSRRGAGKAAGGASLPLGISDFRFEISEGTAR
jgi:hypothetical protein